MPKLIAKKRDWLVLGFNIFSKEGYKGLVVERMAKKLKCNKSSFYWYFNSKDEFLDALIHYWRAHGTHYIIEQVGLESDPKKKVRKFINLVFRYDPYYDFKFFLRRYSIDKPEILQIIEEIDRTRLAFTTTLFQELGYKKSEARTCASILYKYLLGYHELYGFSASDRKNQLTVSRELSHILGKNI